MTDKNNVTMKTGDIVRIENAYFKNDNGYYYIEHTPGDPSWCGGDYSLHKIGKRGKISTASYSIAFWPLSAFCSDRAKNAASHEHNEKYATIEVVYDIDNSEVIAHFEEEANSHRETGKIYAYRFGEDSETTTKTFKIADFYQSIADRMKDEKTPAQEAAPETTPEEQEAAPEETAPAKESEEITEAPTQEKPADIPAKYYDISESTAERAWYAVHMGDYKKNSATNEYRASVDEAHRIAEAQKKKVSSYYHDKIDALLDRYSRKLATWYNDYNRNEASCPSWFISGPANYPVRKHERKMNRERSLWEEYDQIKAIVDKIKAVGTGPIDLADPHAREMLTERIEKLKNTLEHSKDINAYYRKNKTMIGFPGMSPEKAEEMTATVKETLERCPWITQPIPAYELTSLRDKIKRTEERLQELDRRQNLTVEEEQHEGFQIVRNVEIDRLQILFEDIPDADTRTALKSNGFRWSPRYKAWQRQLTDNAERAARLALNLN